MGNVPIDPTSGAGLNPVLALAAFSLKFQGRNRPHLGNPLDDVRKISRPSNPLYDQFCKELGKFVRDVDGAYGNDARNRVHDNADTARAYVASIRELGGISPDKVDGIYKIINQAESDATRTGSPYAGRVAGWTFLPKD